MKKLLFIALFLLTFTNVDAQNRIERLKAYKSAFFTEELELTIEESRAFWPIYDEFEREKEELKNQYNRRNGSLEDLTDDELEAFILQQFDYEEKELALKKKYFQAFKAALPIQKIARINRVERQFKKRVLDMIQDRRERRRGNN